MRTRRPTVASRASLIERLENRRILSVHPLGPEFQANTFVAGGQRAAAVAMDADGHFVVAWQSPDQDGDGYGIFARRFSAAGVPLSAEIPVNSFTTGSQTSPAIAVDSDGDFIVAWTSDGQDGALTGIYAQRVNSSGAPQGGEFRANTHTTGRQQGAAVAMDQAGNFVIAWESSGQDGSGQSIHAQRYDAAGVPQGGEFRVNTATLNNQSAPAIAADATGGFVVVWESSGQDGSGLSVHGQRYDAAGAAQGAEFRVNSYTTNNQSAPSVAMDADGDFVIGWESYLQDGGHLGIYAQRYDASGLPQGLEFRVNTVTTGNQSAASVAMDDSGDFVVAWRSADDNGFGIYAQGYFASGETNDIERPVNTETASVQTLPAAAMDGDADIVIAWQSFGQDGSSYGIYARRYQMLGGVVDSEFLFETAPHRLQFRFDADFSAGLDNSDLLVENLTTSQTIPSTDFSLAYDPVTETATFSYAGAAGGISGVLPDGEYRATLLAVGVPLPADYVREFFFLRGDANHDGIVNLSDFNVLAANFGQNPRDFTQGDFNYDMLVSLEDFNLLASRFGTFLAPARFPFDGLTERDRAR